MSKLVDEIRDLLKRLEHIDDCDVAGCPECFFDDLDGRRECYEPVIKDRILELCPGLIMLVDELNRNNRKLIKQIEIQKNKLNQYATCPDCRDKMDAGRCWRCEVQRLENKLAEKQERRDKEIEQLKTDCAVRESALYKIREQFPDHEASRIAGHGLTIGVHDCIRNLRVRVERMEKTMEDNDPKVEIVRCTGCKKLEKLLGNARAGLEAIKAHMANDTTFNLLEIEVASALEESDLLGDCFNDLELDDCDDEKVNMSQKPCYRCNDTHLMDLDDRKVMCTACPTPCEKCRKNGTGAYCTDTPCECDCHK